VRRGALLCGVRRAGAATFRRRQTSLDVDTSRDVKFPYLIDIARSLLLSTVIRAPSTGIAAMTLEIGPFRDRHHRFD
jgi:hypothetical protein